MLEEDLVQRAKAGDEGALRRLLWSHHDRLAAAIAPRMRRDLKRHLEVEDILHDTYVIAIRKIRDFEPAGPNVFYAWLKKIAEHRVLDMVKAQHREMREVRRTVSLPEGAVVYPDTPSHLARAREAVRAALAELETIKPETRDAIRLRFLEGRSVADIASRLKRTNGAVSMLIRRGLQTLRDRLGSLSRFRTHLP
jgi:RNA polymerase sigma-70 factor (ECF subfamily)